MNAVMGRWATPTTLALLTACAPGEPVPDDLVDPTVGLFADLNTGDADTWASAVLGWILAQDGTAPLSGRTFAPGPLDPDRVSLDDGTPVVATRLAVGVLELSEHDVDDHRRRSMLEAAACAEPPWTVSFDRTRADDGCWTLGSCRDASATSVIVDATPQGTLTYAISEGYVRVEAAQDPETDVDVWVRRWWTTAAAVATAPGDGLDHAYGLRVWVANPEDGRTTWRLDVQWSDLRLAGVNEADTADALAQAIADGQAATEAFLSAGSTTCDAEEGS